MASQDRVTNKARFEDGDKPTGSNYADLIDSFISLADTTAQVAASDIQTPRLIATTEVSSPQVNATEVSASVGSFTILGAGTVSANTIRATDISASSMTLAGTFVVSGASTLHGRVQVGDAATRGDIVLVQQQRLSASTTKVTAAVLPDGADVLDIKFFVETPFASGATQIDVLVGTSTHDTRFARFSGVTAQGYYTVTDRTQTSAWTNVSGANANVIVHTTAVSGAVASAASGILSIMYVSKQ